MDVENGKDIRFLYGKKLRKLRQLHSFPIDGAFLPPWDRALRAGLIVKGSPGETAIFECFEMKAIEE
jgi:hypothetical protein